MSLLYFWPLYINDLSGEKLSHVLSLRQICLEHKYDCGRRRSLRRRRAPCRLGIPVDDDTDNDTLLLREEAKAFANENDLLTTWNVENCCLREAADNLLLEGDSIYVLGVDKMYDCKIVGKPNDWKDVWLTCEKLVRNILTDLQKRGRSIPLNTEFEIGHLTQVRWRRIWQVHVCVNLGSCSGTCSLAMYDGEKSFGRKSCLLEQ